MTHAARACTYRTINSWWSHWNWVDCRTLYLAGSSLVKAQPNLKLASQGRPTPLRYSRIFACIHDKLKKKSMDRAHPICWQILSHRLVIRQASKPNTGQDVFKEPIAYHWVYVDTKAIAIQFITPIVLPTFCQHFVLVAIVFIGIHCRIL